MGEIACTCVECGEDIYSWTFMAQVFSVKEWICEGCFDEFCFVMEDE